MSPRAARRAAGTVLGLALVVVHAAGASAADLIDAEQTTITTEAPAPGEAQSFDLSVTSVTDRPVPLDLVVVEHSGQMFRGAAPVELTLTDDHGATVLPPTAAPALLDASIDLPDLAPGSTYHLTGTLTLPRAAGDEYQGATGEVVLRFRVPGDRAAGGAPDGDRAASSASNSSGGASPSGLRPTDVDRSQASGPSSGLATTGPTVSTVAAVSLGLVVAGAVLARRRRRGSDA